jgi:two-component system response regulator RegA
MREIENSRSMEEKQSNSACILAADDDFDTQKILSDFLSYHGYEVLVATSGDQALKLAEALSPGLALVDVRMPGPSGISLTCQLKKVVPHIEVIIMTAYATVEEAAEAIRQGAFHYLAKPLNLEGVLALVQEALANQPADPSSPVEIERLSKRRMQVLQLLADGKTNREIGDNLCLSEKTVANYVSTILKILHVPNRGRAVAKARDLRLLDE